MSMPLDVLGFGTSATETTADLAIQPSQTVSGGPTASPQRPRLAAPLLEGRVVCPRCSAEYLPRLVQWACPVCRTPSPGQHARRPPLREDDRLLLIVALATIANIIVLGLLAVAILK